MLKCCAIVHVRGGHWAAKHFESDSHNSAWMFLHNSVGSREKFWRGPNVTNMCVEGSGRKGCNSSSNISAEKGVAVWLTHSLQSHLAIEQATCRVPVGRHWLCRLLQLHAIYNTDAAAENHLWRAAPRNESFYCPSLRRKLCLERNWNDVQGDTSGRTKPIVDMKTKIAFQYKSSLY